MHTCSDRNEVGITKDVVHGNAPDFHHLGETLDIIACISYFKMYILIQQILDRQMGNKRPKTCIPYYRLGIKDGNLTGS